jgi:hypothetical protein
MMAEELDDCRKMPEALAFVFNMTYVFFSCVCRCYKGEWRNGMAHGKGRETYADGSVRHDGQWVSKDKSTEHTFLLVAVGLSLN